MQTLESSRGANSGIATLDAGGDVPLSQLGNVPGGGGSGAATVLAASTPVASETLDVASVPQVWKTYNLSAVATTVTLSNAVAGGTVVLRVQQPAGGGLLFNVSDGVQTAAVDVDTTPNAVTDVLVKCFSATDLVVTVLGSGIRLPTTVTSPAATLTFSAPAPSLIVPRTIVAVPAVVTFSAPVPTLNIAGANQTVTAVPAVVTFSAPAPTLPAALAPATVDINADTLSFTDGQTVSGTLADSSGNGHTLDAGAGVGLTYKVAVVNGHNAIRMAAGANMSFGNLSAVFPTAATLIVRINAPSGNYDLINTGITDEFWSFGGGAAGYLGTWRTARMAAYPASGMPQSGAHIIAVRSSSSQFQIRLDGVAQAGGTASFSSGGVVQVGAGAGASFSGDVSRILMFNSALSDAQVAAWEAALA